MKSSARGKSPVRLLVLHTTEGMMRNSDLKAFFNRANAAGSSHASADNTSGLMESGFVPYDRAAWTLRSGNPISDNLEQCGYAKWSRTYWMEERKPTLEAAALWLAKRSVARGIPLRYLTHTQLRKGEAGVIQHNDWSVAMKDGSHWDCGPGYPIDWVISRAQQIKATLVPGKAGDKVTPAPAKIDKDENMLQNILVPATTGIKVQRLLLPTGPRVSGVTSRAWFSAAVNGPDAGHVKGWFQTDVGGIAPDFEMWLTFANGLSEREWREFPQGATQLNLHYNFPQGGVFLLEAVSQ